MFVIFFLKAPGKATDEKNLNVNAGQLNCAITRTYRFITPVDVCLLKSTAKHGLYQQKGYCTRVAYSQE